MREKKTSLHFAGRTHSRNGIIAVVMGGIAWCVFLALCIYSTSTGGNTEPVAGVIGILDAVFTLMGLFIAMKGFKERDVYYVLPMVGLVMNGILFVIYFALYFMGIAIA